MNRNPFAMTSSESIEEHAFSVLACLYGMEEIWKLTPPGGQHETFTVIYSKGEELFEKHILSLATIARIKDQGINSLSKHTMKNPSGVGELTENKKTTTLTAREACNKIIHANTAKINWETIKGHPIYHDVYMEKYGDDEESYRHPFLFLSGYHLNKEWEAKINMIVWVHAVVGYTF